MLGKSVLTHGGDPIALSEELSFDEMVALAGLFRRWAIYDEGASQEHRTQYIAMSADLEELAECVGEGWRASNPAPELTLLPFLARQALQQRNVIDFRGAKHALSWETSPGAAILRNAGPQELKLLRGLLRRNPIKLSHLFEDLAKQDRAGLRRTLKAYLAQDYHDAEEAFGFDLGWPTERSERRRRVLIRAALRLELLLRESKDSEADRISAVRLLDDGGFLKREPKERSDHAEFARELIENNPLLYVAVDRLAREPDFKANTIRELILSLIPS